MEEMIFAPGSVPVAVVARVYGKDASWVRAGIISGWLPIGKATRNGKVDYQYRRDEFEVRTHQLLYFSKAALGRNRIFMERRETLIWQQRFVQNYPRKTHIGLSVIGTMN